jgi:hypothetical protein
VHHLPGGGIYDVRQPGNGCKRGFERGIFVSETLRRMTADREPAAAILYVASEFFESDAAIWSLKNIDAMARIISIY